MNGSFFVSEVVVGVDIHEFFDIFLEEVEGIFMLVDLLFGGEFGLLFLMGEFLLQGENELVRGITDDFVDEDIGVSIKFKVQVSLTFG